MKKIFCILTVAFVMVGLVGCASTGKGKSNAKLMIDPPTVTMSKKATVNLSGQGFMPGEEVVILFTAVDGVVSDIGFALDPQPVVDESGAWTTTWKCGRFISKKLIKEGSYTLKAADAEYNVLTEATVMFKAGN